ncbi:MAG: hypothetical protein JSU61_01940 [Fidelibacterota bacterium]|nr:MAG: hypothetical protein JSU61_01940 [Candidatus Neomarinimicrobiota bacterium]
MTVRQEPELSGWSSVWRWLVHPITAIQDATVRQDEQLLLMLLVFLIPLMVVATLAAAVMLGYGFWREAFFYIPIAVLAGYILAFLLGRRGWCKSGAVLSTGCMYVGIWTAILLNPIPAYVAFDLLLVALLLPVFMLGLFFPLSAFIVAVLFNLVLIWFLPALMGAHILTSISTIIVSAGFSAVAIVAIYHRNQQNAECR